tara:strand:+ start:35 stop:637 length:603 start_codon:yes stop_codon:yes gene_type:complete
MNALNHFIVHVPKKHEDTIKIGDKEIWFDPKYNEFENRISYGEIISSPLKHDTGAKPGDTLIFHHHVTINKALDIGDDNYVCMYDKVHGNLSASIAYRSKDTGEIKMLCDWLFVLPVDKPGDDVEESGIITKVAAFKEKRNVAEVYTPHPDLSDQGVNPGDIIGFDKNSDYKIKLDNGDIVYRMRVDDISYVEVEEVHND